MVENVHEGEYDHLEGETQRERTKELVITKMEFDERGVEENLKKYLQQRGYPDEMRNLWMKRWRLKRQSLNCLQADWEREQRELEESRVLVGQKVEMETEEKKEEKAEKGQ